MFYPDWGTSPYTIFNIVLPLMWLPWVDVRDVYYSVSEYFNYMRLIVLCEKMAMPHWLLGFQIYLKCYLVYIANGSRALLSILGRFIKIIIIITWRHGRDINNSDIELVLMAYYIWYDVEWYFILNRSSGTLHGNYYQFKRFPLQYNVMHVKLVLMIMNFVIYLKNCVWKPQN